MVAPARWINNHESSSMLANAWGGGGGKCGLGLDLVLDGSFYCQLYKLFHGDELMDHYIFLRVVKFDCPERASMSVAAIYYKHLAIDIFNDWIFCLNTPGKSSPPCYAGDESWNKHVKMGKETTSKSTLRNRPSRHGAG